jgi:hypothetical protein
MTFIKTFTLLFLCILNLGVFAQKFSVTTNPQDADIFVNGKKVGIGEVVIRLRRNECVTIETSKEGYLSVIKEYCNKPNFPKAPKSDYLTLKIDDSYEASTKNDIANNDIVLKPKKGMIGDNWKTAIRVITNYFDALEVSDSDVKYLRTSWIIDSFEGYTVRSRVILRYVNEDPQEMKIKLISQIASGSAVSAKSDEKYKDWDRVLKKYNNLLDEVRTRANAY